jgi:hypothetical protein
VAGHRYRTPPRDGGATTTKAVCPNAFRHPKTRACARLRQAQKGSQLVEHLAKSRDVTATVSNEQLVSAR